MFDKRRQAASEALGCSIENLQLGRVWGGTRYNDGVQDLCYRFFEEGTDRSVVIFEYHDGVVRAGRVDE